MRILFYTDLHAADQTPRSRTGSYKEDILTKLREIIQLANDLDVDMLINGADTFDRKSSWRVSHRLVREMIDVMREFPKQHLTVVGTHDVPTGQLEKLAQQPLGVLMEAGVIDVIGAPVTKPLGDHGKVGIHAVPASYDLDKDPANYAVQRPEGYTPPIITVAHGMIVPPGGSFFGDYTDADTIRTDADLVLYGHPHTPDGIYKNSSDTVFVGPGSVSRRDASPYNRTRTPEVVLIGLDEPGSSVMERWSFKSIPLQSARPGAEVFADLISEEEDENVRNAQIDQFTRDLAGTDIKEDSWGSDQLLAEIRSADAPEDVRKKAEEILESVDK